MLIITGGAGFIGSSLAWKCNLEGRSDIIIVDHLKDSEKWKNLVGINYSEYMHKDSFLESVKNNAEWLSKVDAIIHLGACSATTEKDADYLMENNYRYTRILAEWAIAHKKRFIYASSAATYGEGAEGFDDNHSGIPGLKPINRYGYSKQFFDNVAFNNDWLDKVVGIKFFNVFGPNEYHKDDMRSVICKAYAQVKDAGIIRLFKSYKNEYADGGQMRDFVYVKDCVNVLWWLLENRSVNGIYNLGTGRARSWNDLATAIFNAMNVPVNIEYIDMPIDIRSHYQYYTKASTEKLKKVNCPVSFTSLEESVADYVQSYLAKSNFLSVK
jgi:ADP-L-glycero-D-manno-heptose 6-epimerase